ncbi:MAG: glycosyl transferase family 2 [Bacteroidia bacterium]|nr:MAG: glycosyl transferase family 2 [Bacteroidia bacterium]PIE85867.1 MAG: glycosyl transferase family 2 [Bacteroidia bacterium]
MKLSIIIVNYNVKYFLEQCLYSVRKALKNLVAEVFVVDNNSVDGSCEMVAEKFPEVMLIRNKHNSGFSVANNQAIKRAKGEYVLLLNPDTLVEEDTFTKIIDFMDAKPDAGGLGVKMIDGNGNFLPESKRGLPTPMVAFYKIFGISKLFPKSKTFGKYHLGWLDKDKIHEIEILSGAFMFMRKKALDKVGMLDESFFMYGEDIDLSYRILLGGFKNYYFPETTIIHYKGESTKKGSINYVLVFYNAMIIFAKKHFSRQKADIFSFLIKTAVYFRAGLSILKRFLQTIVFPALDSLLIFLGYFLMTPKWEQIKFEEGGHYPAEYLNFAVPGYIAVWLLSMLSVGAYKKPFKLASLAKGIALGTMVILLAYSLLSEAYRFSRALILLGTLWTFVAVIGLRGLIHLLNIPPFKFDKSRKKNIIIVGNQAEYKRILPILQNSEINTGFVGRVEVSGNQNKDAKKTDAIASVEQMQEIVRIHKIHEIIFCATDISSQEIIKKMLDFSSLDIAFKIAPPESLSIIGSNSIHTSGELYVIDFNSISKASNRRYKRLLDLILAAGFFVSFPLLAWAVEKKANFFKNILAVMSGKKSWVAYAPTKKQQKALPKIKNGILSPTQGILNPNDQLAHEKNIIYAKNYKIINDLHIIYKGFRNLGA